MKILSVILLIALIFLGKSYMDLKSTLKAERLEAKSKQDLCNSTFAQNDYLREQIEKLSEVLSKSSKK